jgi:predicted short-subunit dehydrogenase-like oxidoreductase (DUF2520 family)
VADYYDIAIIGTGNMAWHLAPELENAGHHVTDIYGRTPKNAKALQRKLYNAEISPTLDFSESDAEVYILAVSDDAVEQVAREIILPEGALVFHTSGALAANKLAYVSTEHFGVLYPLQTFTKGKLVRFNDIPILVEGNTKHAIRVLKNLGKSISKKVYEVAAGDRTAVHVAAVFACNFSNKMMAIAGEILEENKFDFELLRPLIAETINKSLDIGPIAAQTGPAIRGDLETLDKHMEFLKHSPYRDLYKMITQNILEQ